MAETDKHRFDGKVVMVTGAGSGIGRATAIAFAAAGASVVAVGRHDDPLEETAHVIEGGGGTVEVIPTDIARAAEVEALMDGTIKRFGRLDVAFNNAGIEIFKPIEQLTEADFDELIGIDLKGTWFCTKHAVQAMQRRGGGGAIVNTSSWLVDGGYAGSSLYSAAKGGLDGMMRSLALELGPQGIRINNVSPGVIDTPMSHRNGDAAALEAFADHAALKRLGTAEEVAEVVLWLASDAARYVTGQVILVDGGFAIGGPH